MTDLPDWDRPSLDDWRPTASQTSRAVELWSAYISDDPDIVNLFNGFCNDVLVEKDLPQKLLAVLEHGRLYMHGLQGEALTEKRLAADVVRANDDALEEFR